MDDATTTTQGYRGISVGRVFGRSIAAIRANPVPMLGLGFVCMGLPQLLLQQVGYGAALVGLNPALFYLAAATVGLVAGVLWLVASGGIVQAVIAHDRNAPATLAEMVRTGVRRCLPLLAVYLLYLIGVWFGMILLIVPGVMLGVMWAVAMPAVVGEHTGIIGAFGRSRALTKGARWEVFGILLLALVFYTLVSVALGLVAVAGGGSLAMLTVEGAMPVPSLLGAVFQSVVGTAVLVWVTSVGASLFVELRHWKDGPTADRLADIFA